MEPPTTTTDETYKKHIASEGISEEIETLDGFSLCWLGSKTAKKVILYVHGGALMMSAYDTHIKFLIQAYRLMQANKQDISIAILVYGLAPGVPYPAQVRYTAAAVQHLLKSRKSESILFSGDSCGGQMILATLLHHLHPHPNIPAYDLSAGSRFGEICLISPGSPVITETASMLNEPNKDVINLAWGREAWKTISSTSEPGLEMPNPWIALSSAPEGWWKGLPVEKITIILGDWEILKDDILIFSGHLKKYHDKEVDVQVFADEFHEQGLVDLGMGAPEKENGSAKYWKAWFQSLQA